jgi:hypothetical protein
LLIKLYFHLEAHVENGLWGEYQHLLRRNNDQGGLNSILNSCEISLWKQEICEKIVIWVWPSWSFIPSNKKVKVPWQPFHIPTNPKQAKSSQKSTICKSPNFWGVYLIILRWFLLFSTWATKLLTDIHTPSWRQCY